MRFKIVFSFVSFLSMVLTWELIDLIYSHSVKMGTASDVLLP